MRAQRSSIIGAKPPDFQPQGHNAGSATRSPAKRGQHFSPGRLLAPRSQPHTWRAHIAARSSVSRAATMSAYAGTAARSARVSLARLSLAARMRARHLRCTRMTVMATLKLSTSSLRRFLKCLAIRRSIWSLSSPSGICVALQRLTSSNAVLVANGGRGHRKAVGTAAQRPGYRASGPVRRQERQRWHSLGRGKSPRPLFRPTCGMAPCPPPGGCPGRTQSAARPCPRRRGPGPWGAATCKTRRWAGPSLDRRLAGPIGPSTQTVCSTPTSLTAPACVLPQALTATRFSAAASKLGCGALPAAHLSNSASRSFGSMLPEPSSYSDPRGRRGGGVARATVSLEGCRLQMKRHCF